MSEAHKPDEETVKAYASSANLDLDAARKRLETNYKKEVEEVDAKEVALKCIRTLRQLSPKVQGMEFRETETQYTLKKLETSVAKMHNDLELHKEIAKQSVATVNQILKEFDEYADKISKLEMAVASQEEHFKQRNKRLHSQYLGLHKTIRENYSIITETMMGNYDPRLERIEAKLFKPSLYERICLKLRYLRKR